MKSTLGMVIDRKVVNAGGIFDRAKIHGWMAQ